MPHIIYSFLHKLLISFNQLIFKIIIHSEQTINIFLQLSILFNNILHTRVLVLIVLYHSWLWMRVGLWCGWAFCILMIVMRGRGRTFLRFLCYCELCWLGVWVWLRAALGEAVRLGSHAGVSVSVVLLFYIARLIWYLDMDVILSSFFKLRLDFFQHVQRQINCFSFVISTALIVFKTHGVTRIR